ncbi:sugar phosphate isomerase/epimerase family protein [Kineococcus sp. LSe6-4]|uniref:Sugar phosphate isomerase/epimerase family protein n=1 Tax=Kineococcus halophytocola TaxID=3234027 RepID=A0ABV4GZU2_9ACTN
MLIPGLCSVTFRQLDPPALLDLAARAGLATVEWGADVHVPVGDRARAREVAARTADAGLTVASYGSYLRAGVAGGAEGGPDVADVLGTAAALGAPRVRVWAGDTGSAGTGDRGPVVRALADAVRRADDLGLQIGTESHGGTLTDTTDSTLRLLREVDDLVGRPALTTYWQPTVDATDEEALAELAAFGDRVSTVHAFSWGPGTQRNPLRTREALWTRVAAALRESGDGHDVLLEFVPEDDPDVLAREAMALREWLNAAPATR